MDYKRSTFVPNTLFDTHLKELTHAELKILLVIIRQTNGWIDKKTGKRKKRDRITHKQFQGKTGLSGRIIILAIQTLIEKGLIVVTNFNNEPLATHNLRKGQRSLFYALQHVQKTSETYAKKILQHLQKGAYNKTNYPKLKKTKEKNIKSIKEVIEGSTWNV